jgi:Domain of unknown function (DUF4403)
MGRPQIFGRLLISIQKKSKETEMRVLKSVILIIITFNLACSQQKNKQTNAEAPAESYSYNDKQVKAERYLSTLNLSLNIGLIDIENQINNQLQGLIFEDNSMEDNNNDQFMAKVWKREPIKASALNNEILFKVPLKVWLKVGYKAAPLGFEISTVKETEFDFNVNFKSTFSISNKWDAITKTTLVNYEFITTPKVKVGPIEVPVTSMLKKALDAKAPEIIKALDKSIKDKIEIKKYIIQAWNQTIQPYMLSEKYRTWLKVSPVELQLSPIFIEKNIVKANIGIKAFTETVTGTKPVVNAVNNVPDLVLVSKITDDFQVGILSEISHGEAVTLAKDTLIGQKFEFQNGKHAVTVTNIDIYGNENQLIIKTDLIGSLNGTIYFKGMPYYDEKSRSIKLTNFDYDLKTKSLLAKAANWLLGGKLAKTMQESLEIPCGSSIDEIKKQIQDNLTNNKLKKGIILQGNINDLSPDKVYLTPTSIIARVMATGKVGLKIDGI